MLSILQLEHTAPETAGLHLHPVSRIWLSWLIRHTPFVHFTHYFFKVFVQVQVLCVPALHHLPQVCHNELWASQFFVKCIKYSLGVLGPTSVLLRNFCSGLHRGCAASRQSSLQQIPDHPSFFCILVFRP